MAAAPPRIEPREDSMQKRLLLTTFAAALVISAAPAAAQEAMRAPLEEAVQIDPGTSPEEYVDEYYEEEYYEEEFCGGEEGPYDEAIYAFDAEDYAGARTILVDALRSGDFGGLTRVDYLVLLGQTQLRLDENLHAAVNFSRAVSMAPDRADDNGARIGLAIALARRGERDRAAETAQEHIEAGCGTRTQMECYLAHVVVASASSDDETRATARAEALQIQAELPEWQRSAIAYYDTLFGVAEWTPSADVRAASAADTTDAADTADTDESA
jgi:hypothetical protein